MFVPYIPSSTLPSYIALPKVAKLLETTVSVVEEKCWQYRIPIRFKYMESGLEKRSFLELCKRLNEE